MKAVDIGITLYQVAQLFPQDSFHDLDKLSEQVLARQLSGDAMHAWDIFIAKHGMRGPGEMEVFNPRYREHPKLALEQMASMRHASENPALTLQKHVKEREQSYQQLMTELPHGQAKKLRKHYEIVKELSPTRDTMKYILVIINAKIRQLALRDGQAFTKADRLVQPEDIFFLTFEQIVAAHNDDKLDLNALVTKHKPAFEQAAENIKSFPVLIDSRGRIPSSVQTTKNNMELTDPNVLKGCGISRGVVRGRVKIFNNPREKTIEKGDILVTYNTDPGWTPLFIGAEAIILEVGAVHCSTVVLSLGSMANRASQAFKGSRKNYMMVNG